MGRDMVSPLSSQETIYELLDYPIYATPSSAVLKSL